MSVSLHVHLSYQDLLGLKESVALEIYQHLEEDEYGAGLLAFVLQVDVFYVMVFTRLGDRLMLAIMLHHLFPIHHP